MRGPEAGASGTVPVRRAPSGRGRSPRVGLVAGCPFPAPRGSQVLVDGMACALAGAGVDVHLFAPIVPGCARPYPLHSIAGEGAFPSAEPAFGTRLRRLLGDVGLANRLREAVLRERVDVLHAHNYEALLASLRVRASTGVPVVFHAHAVLADELPLYASSRVLPTAVASRLGTWCDRTFPRLADHVVALSDDVARYLERCGVDPARIAVVPPGIEAPGPGENEQGRRPRAVFTGNLDRYQNLDLLLRSWSLVERRLPDATLAVVTHERDRTLPGDVPGLARVELVRARGLGDVRREWSRATVGVSPRTSWSGFPVKTLNYMAAGLPTVALEGSSKGIRDGESGWVVRGTSAEALAGALCEALDDPRECGVRGRNARAVLDEEHAWPRLAEDLLELSSAIALGRRRVGLSPAARPG